MDKDNNSKKIANLHQTHNIQIGHEFNGMYKVLLYGNLDAHFVDGEEDLFVFKMPDSCPKTLEELKELKISQNCDDEQLEILLKWFKSPATTRVLGRKKDYENYLEFESIFIEHLRTFKINEIFLKNFHDRYSRNRKLK